MSDDTLQAASTAFYALNEDLESLWCTSEVLSEIQGGTFNRKVKAHPSKPYTPSDDEDDDDDDDGDDDDDAEVKSA